jgi:RNA polymerase sigma-70 factor (ECF subfamily)
MDQAPTERFDDWLRGSRPRLVRLALSRLGDRGEAEDVVQETLLAVWKRHNAGAVQDLDAYADRAVWLNAVRRRTRLKDWEAIEDAELDGLAGTEPDAEAWLEARALERAVEGLPAPQRAAIRLRFYAGMSFREMSGALSIGLDTAASRTRYALNALRKALAGPAPAAPPAGKGRIEVALTEEDLLDDELMAEELVKEELVEEELVEDELVEVELMEEGLIEEELMEEELAQREPYAKEAGRGKK